MIHLNHIYEFGVKILQKNNTYKLEALIQSIYYIMSPINYGYFPLFYSLKNIYFISKDYLYSLDVPLLR